MQREEKCFPGNSRAAKAVVVIPISNALEAEALKKQYDCVWDQFRKKPAIFIAAGII